MKQFDTLFSQIRDLLHREDVNVGEAIDTILQQAHAIDARRCLEVLCPYVNNHLKQHYKAPVDLYLMDGILTAHPVTYHVPELYRIEMDNTAGYLSDDIIAELQDLWIEYTITELLEFDGQYHVIPPEHADLVDNIRNLYMFTSHLQLLKYYPEPLPALEYICFYEPVTEKNMQKLHASSLLRNLRKLTFCTADQRDDILPRLDIPWSNLLEFGFEDGQCLGGLAELMAQDKMSQLIYFSLSGTAITEATQQALLETDLQRTQTVWLTDCKLGDDVMAQLISAGTLPMLHRAVLVRNNLTDAFAAQLCRYTSQTPFLRELNLSGNPLTNKGLADLAKWEGLQSVETLSLHTTQIDTEGLAILAESPFIGRLKHLLVSQVDANIKLMFDHLPTLEVTTP